MIEEIFFCYIAPTDIFLPIYSIRLEVLNLLKRQFFDLRRRAKATLISLHFHNMTSKKSL